MAENPRPRNHTAFGLVLLLLCVLPAAGYWWWKSTVPAICAPVVYELRPGMTLELRAVSLGQYGSNKYWSPNGVPIPQGDLIHSSSPDIRMRTLYLQRVTRNASEKDYPDVRIRASPVIPGVVIGSVSGSQRDPESGDLKTNYKFSCAPRVATFQSTELEVSYSSLGFFDVGVLEAGETQREFSVAGETIVVSLGDNVTHKEYQYRVEIQWKSTDVEFDILRIDAAGESIRPRNQGRSDGRTTKKHFAEFSDEEFSQFKIRAFRRDKTIRFSGVSYDPGSYTRPSVTAVTP